MSADQTRERVRALALDLCNTLSDPTQAWDIAVADFNYEVNRLVSDYHHTHVSVRDGSPAMVISEFGSRITLVNEDGFVWTDPADQWRPL